MKTKVLVVLFTVLFALAMMAQTATQAAPSAPATGDKATTCACCNHDMANMKPGDKCPMMKDGKMANGKACCGKDGGCCKDGKCDMAAHKDGKMGCCGDKCPMIKDGKTASGKSCCGGKCPMMSSVKPATGASCCAKGAACCKGGYMPCCDANKTAA